MLVHRVRWLGAALLQLMVIFYKSIDVTGYRPCSTYVAATAVLPVDEPLQAVQSRRADRSRGERLNSSISQVVIAILGIGGTLAAAVITQRGADRARTRELEHTRQLQREEREYAAHEAQMEQRRTCYAALSAGTRDLANVMAKVLHALEKGELTEELRSDLDRARRDHRLRHAEAQMILPDGVARAASTANRYLGDLYGLLMRPHGNTARDGESLEAAREGLDKLWDPLWAMRHVMRVDLGITAPDQDQRQGEADRCQA
ncbi:hypothetical protein SRIMR7_40560 [Streptomyces rimosus subsp. rimosus]|uniref:Uncharacterized protein n=2 Tax=Streptomyces TaxID=1883 RepID=A0ABY3ZEB5_STRRM|nr:hypothetical protein SRIMR7_40560 [Streptomyces rimosus subsp. rimosus]